MEQERTSGGSKGRAKRYLEKRRLSELLEMPKETAYKHLQEMESTIEKLEKKIISLQKMVDVKDKEILSLKTHKKKRSKYDGYDKALSTIEKIRFILSRNKKELPFRSIRDILLELEPELLDRWGNVDQSVSQALSKGSKLGAIFQTKAYGGSRGHSVYSLP